MTPRQVRLCEALFSGLNRLRRRRPQACILCYHSCHPSPSPRFCTPELLDRHLAWLKANCELTPLRELVNSPAAKAGGRPRVAITFDDGHLDNFVHALPLLLKHGAPATLFVTVGYIDRAPRALDRFNLYLARDRRAAEPMSWEQVRAMAEAGFAVEAHSYSHANLNLLNSGERRLEIADCKAMLEDRIRQRVVGFAYPFGQPRCHFGPDAVELAREAGYEFAVTTVARTLGRRDSRMLLPRLCIGSDHLTTLADKIAGAWNPLGWFNQRAPACVARLISPRGFRASTYG
ncbi:MAG: polysaccharide deacetylase family protein [Bryobacteraceae bacterium]|nr:polysaccharide deacetylase family protein [Bryobacteraceae bacterium]